MSDDPDYIPGSGRVPKKRENIKLKTLKKKDKIIQGLQARCERYEKKIEKLEASGKKRKNNIKMLKKDVAELSGGLFQTHRDLGRAEKNLEKLQRTIIPALKKKVEDLSNSIAGGVSNGPQCGWCKKSFVWDDNLSKCPRRKRPGGKDIITVCPACLEHIEALKKDNKKNKRRETCEKKKEARKVELLKRQDETTAIVNPF